MLIDSAGSISTTSNANLSSEPCLLSGGSVIVMATSSSGKCPKWHVAPKPPGCGGDRRSDSYPRPRLRSCPLEVLRPQSHGVWGGRGAATFGGVGVYVRGFCVPATDQALGLAGAPHTASVVWPSCCLARASGFAESQRKGVGVKRFGSLVVVTSVVAACVVGLAGVTGASPCCAARDPRGAPRSSPVSADAPPLPSSLTRACYPGTLMRIG
jgi:hypothetical protein